jgi:hypothetical protein
MAAQLNYNYGTPKGVPGGKFDIAFDEVVTRKNENEDGIMKYGLAVAVGTDAGNGIKIPVTGTTAAQIEGITIALPNTEQDMAGKVVVKKNASLSVMKKGNIWGRLATGATPTYGAKAYVIPEGDEAGTFTNAADNGKSDSGKVEYLDISATFGNASDDGIAVIVL